MDYRRAAAFLTEERDKLAIANFPLSQDKWRYYLGILRLLAALVELTINTPFLIEILEIHKRTLEVVEEHFCMFVFGSYFSFSFLACLLCFAHILLILL
jgi:hypothetical protein